MGKIEELAVCKIFWFFRRFVLKFYYLGFGFLKLFVLVVDRDGERSWRIIWRAVLEGVGFSFVFLVGRVLDFRF